MPDTINYNTLIDTFASALERYNLGPEATEREIWPVARALSIDFKLLEDMLTNRMAEDADNS